RRRAIAIGALAIWLIQVGLVSSLARTGAYGPASHARTMSDVAALERYLQERGATFGWSDYWTGYELTFLTRERIILAPFNGIDRHPAYTVATHAAAVQSYVLPAGYFPVPA